MREATPPKIIRISKGQFVEAVRASKTSREATKKLGISMAAFYRMRKKSGFNSTSAWASITQDATFRLRPPIPPVVIPDGDGRRFVGTLLGTEGCITCAYASATDTTELALIVEMTDWEWVARFAYVAGSSEPSRTGRKTKPNHKPLFRRAPTGLRALRILVEVLPCLYGQRLREARRAIEYCQRCRNLGRLA